MYQFKHVTEDVEVCLEQPYDDVTSDDLCEMFEQFLLACGFHPESVKRSMNREDE